MEKLSKHFSLDDQLGTCRSKSWFHFLESPIGVGVTTTRQEWNKLRCPFCSGLGICSGQSCLGYEPAKIPSVTKPTLGSVSGNEIPGLEYSSKSTRLDPYSDLKKNKSKKISSLKYPCFIPYKKDEDQKINNPDKSTKKVFKF